jgi:multidrug resistance efflux pump
MKIRRKINRTAIVIITSLVFFLVVSCHKGDKSYTFETAIVKKGSIINTITATGTVEADTTVLIGTQVSGVINKIYVDFNSNVGKDNCWLNWIKHLCRLRCNRPRPLWMIQRVRSGISDCNL